MWPPVRKAFRSSVGRDDLGAPLLVVFARVFAAISALRAALRAVALRNVPAGAVQAAGEFRPAGRVPFCPGRKEPKNRQGVGSGWALTRPYSPTPRTPITGVTPFRWAENFRRAKSGVLECDFSRTHWGPAFAKYTFGAVPLLRLTLPNQRSRSVFRRRGAQCAPAGCRGRRPLRLSRKALAFRRSGCPHPPVNPLSRT